MFNKLTTAEVCVCGCVCPVHLRKQLDWILDLGCSSAFDVCFYLLNLLFFQLFTLNYIGII